MAKLGASSARILFDELDLSGFLNQFDQDTNQPAINVRGFSSTAPEKIVDGYDWTWNFGGFGDFDDGAIDDVVTRDQDDHYCALVPPGYTAGNVAYFGPAKLESETHSGSTGAAVAYSFTLSGEDGLSRGVLLDTRTVTGTVDATGQNLGATSAGTTFAAQVHVVGGTFSDLDIEIQESSDDGSGDAYAAISGFTQSNISAVGRYRFTTTSATEAYKRVSITGFTGTSATVHVVCGTVTD